MPVLGVIAYPTAEQCLQRARVFANDAAISIAGDILSDDQPYIWEMCQAALEELADKLQQKGVNTFNKYATITGLTAAATADPGIMMQLMYTGWFDGQQTHATPQLPADLLEPMELWERQTGTVNRWAPMKQASDSIQTLPQVGAFRIWDWETDILYLPGATQSNDLKMKYKCTVGQITGPDSQVNIADSKNAMAALIVKLAALSRGGTEAVQLMDAEAEDHMRHIVNRTAAKEQYTRFVRKPFRGQNRTRSQR